MSEKMSINCDNHSPSTTPSPLSSYSDDAYSSYHNSHPMDAFEMRYQLSYRIENTLDLTQFELIMTLGEGSFGRVLLVFFGPNKMAYALKILDKSKIVKHDQIEHVQNEIRILNAIKHPNIIMMHSLFTDNSYIYVLLEYVQGGDLFGYIKKIKLFPEHITLFFAAQIVLVFEYLHLFNIIYRDLKPENILVDHHGYLKVADFGFAKRIQQRTYTPCGTLDYFSPEIIQSKGHGKATDWWTLGVLTYEMSTGYPPFKGETEALLFEAICRKKPPLRKNLSSDLRKVVSDLLEKDPAKRLGSSAKGSAEVKEHSWFSKISFDSLYAQQIVSPFHQNVITRTLSDCRQESLTRNEKPLLITQQDHYVDDFKNF